MQYRSTFRRDINSNPELVRTTVNYWNIELSRLCRCNHLRFYSCYLHTARDLPGVATGTVPVTHCRLRFRIPGITFPRLRAT